MNPQLNLRCSFKIIKINPFYNFFNTNTNCLKLKDRLAHPTDENFEHRMPVEVHESVDAELFVAGRAV